MRIKGKIFLSGGGSEKESYLFDQEFIKSLKTRRVLYVPIAMERDMLGYEACYDWITTSLSQFDERFIDITMWLDLDDKSIDDLRQFEAVYFGGGNTYRLLDKIYSSGFDKPLKSYIKEGGIYYGGSAGAIIMGKSIDTVIEENDRNYKHSKGLRLVEDYSFIAHYNKNTEKKNNLAHEFISKHNSPIIAIPEGSGLIVEENSIHVVGKRGVAIFSPEGKRKLVPGSISINY